MQNILVILAGGVGKRFNAAIPKQYFKIGGKQLIDYSIDEMLLSEKTDRIIVVLNDDELQKKRIEKKYDVDIIEGGKERAYSFQNALDYINANYPECKKTVFHESARPLVRHDVVDEYFDLLDEYDYIESCKKINDSLGSYVIKSPRREDYYLIQAPEAYRLQILNQYYDCDSDVYFAANQFPEFIKGYQYYGIKNNIKLTSKEDMAVIEYLLNIKYEEELHD